MSQSKGFTCKSEAQKRAIRANYARMAKAKKSEEWQENKVPNDENVREDGFPEKFPFWARLKINKNRTTLVIDEEKVKDKKNKLVPGFVHREAIHENRSNRDYEIIVPNPDPDDPRLMYLKRPSKLPKALFKPHNKKLNMPEHLITKYDKNNKK